MATSADCAQRLGCAAHHSRDASGDSRDGSSWRLHAKLCAQQCQHVGELLVGHHRASSWHCRRGRGCSRSRSSLGSCSLSLELLLGLLLQLLRLLWLGDGDAVLFGGRGADGVNVAATVRGGEGWGAGVAGPSSQLARLTLIALLEARLADRRTSFSRNPLCRLSNCMSSLCGGGAAGGAVRGESSECG